jgi:hypothetical protein
MYFLIFINSVIVRLGSAFCRPIIDEGMTHE